MPGPTPLRASLRALVLALAAVAGGGPATAEPAPLPREAIAAHVAPPMELGPELDPGRGIYELRNSGGAPAGFVFETGPLAPIPGFSGQPIDMLVTLDRDGRFLDVQLLHHNEPIFVSGLGEAPLRAFLEQYRGHAISEPLVVGTPYGAGGEGSDLVHLDGVTKATASVRIAHESILAAALAVAREKMRGIRTGAPARPDPGHDETLDWDALVREGIARNLAVDNAALQAAFAGSLWAIDDPEALADPAGRYLDLWVVDIGPPAVARAVLDPDGFAELQRFLAVSPEDEPILVVDAGRHGLVSADFVRNTAPDRLSAAQDGLPVALRDADLSFALNDALPERLREGQAMILRTDRRLGFDPTRDWELSAQAVRAHGMFQPELGSRHFTLASRADPRFFLRPEAPVAAVAPWREALRNRQGDLLVLAVALPGLLWALGPGMHGLAAPARAASLRLAWLAAMTLFAGYWAQGQLSIVTVIAVIRAATGGGSFAVLLYDPVSLLIWAAAILGMLAWGRGLFCGWLCPFGALQEATALVGRRLGIRSWEPSPAWDRRLKRVKYLALAGLVAAAFLAPAEAEKLAEIEPFKTAITTGFQREWYYVAYALFWLGLSAVTFKGFCRYLCPLGAVMALGDALRLRRWIPRRDGCGSPCQLCRVRCRYGAIEPSGRIDYAECFACLDCVTIHDDPRTCVPLVLAAKGRTLPAARQGARP
ncbi:4Fe-4S binding protein [Frigidibacter sp. MR17.24]|uniref:4Fe-4S binding protein n=1 Tax=Frigidibacter sp. MR17.24 TaxID=3127345 RepID=UPI003012E616